MDGLITKAEQRIPMTVRSPLIWFGGKSKYAKHLISRFPEHRIYVEPFGGAAHVLAQKPKSQHEVYNDIDGEVVNFLRINQSVPEQLRAACEYIPYSRQVEKEPLPTDPFERAVRWFYMNRSAISSGNADPVSQTGWRHSTVSSQNPAQGYVSACTRLKEFAERFKGVMIEQADFRMVIQKYDHPNALFYVDPPYAGREQFYAGKFTEEDHRDLARLLHRVRGKVVLSYYADPLIDELYSDFRRETFVGQKQVVGCAGREVHTQELILTNFDHYQLTLF
ncbi:DNA adenine methylase [Paenibacillus sp. NRS-1783]|uniref:DNA adenine methylase n=1 Tax=Paenibacillus sp. NRS-1783 TaxID=3233907 RepID=UPI003D2E959B